jgi:hypothetical protein
MWVLVALVLGFFLYRRWVRVRRRRDLLSSTFADRTAGLPRGPRFINPAPKVRPTREG